MNATTLTQGQENKLVHYINDIKNDEEYKMSEHDNILDLFIKDGKIKKGIRENGLSVDEYMQSIGWDMDNLRQKCKARVNLCSFGSVYRKEGYAFGALKDGKFKKYGFSTKKEWEELIPSRKERLISEVKASLLFLDETDKLAELGEKIVKEYDKQLQLIFEEK